MEPNETLAQLGAELLDAFGKKRRVLSFPEYFAMFTEAPQVHARNAARYLLDAFDYYGTETVRHSWGKETRYKLFDAPFDGGRDRLIGQERAQMSVYRILRNFTREGRVNKLVLLHGPNGSAKSTFISCIARALVDYSKRDDGALYTFSWIFPTSKVSKGRFGFETVESALPAELTSYAYLEDRQIDVKLGPELRDHPLFLIPKKRRQAILTERLQTLGLERDFTPSDYILHGDLSPRNRQVFEALLSSYKGDYTRVLAHVQVERFFVSRRYRQGMVTVEPQLQVDAGVRQITADKSLANLPASLQNVTLFEPYGDLVDANRGLIEYNDLLKKPLETFKYLLATSEKGTVSLPNCILYLDLVFLGSSNEKHLSAFKQFPDFQSFKGRFELVRVPYLRSYKTEQSIYDHQVTPESIRKHVAPHASLVAALWAVLTRLRRPEPSHYPKAIQDVVSRLTPIEKARLFAEGKMPTFVAQERRAELQDALSDLFEESESELDYEGSHGASPREMKTILLNASQDEQFPCLSPLAIFAELDRLVADRTVYEFLQVSPDGAFHDPRRFITEVRTFYLDVIDEEFRDAMGLVGESQYLELFTRYITHVSYALKRERLYNAATGTYESPDERFMQEMESGFGVTGSVQDFRQRVVGDVGAYRVDHPSADVDYREIFPKLFEAMRAAYYQKQKQTIARFREQVLVLLNGEGDKLTRADRERAEGAVARLREHFGYCDACARDALRFLHQSRYREG